MDCVFYVLRANLDKPQRSQHILEASIRVESLRLLMRVAAELKLVSVSHLEMYSEKLDEISRMLSGWAHATKKAG